MHWRYINIPPCNATFWITLLVLSQKYRWPSKKAIPIGKYDALLLLLMWSVDTTPANE